MTRWSELERPVEPLCGSSAAEARAFFEGYPPRVRPDAAFVEDTLLPRVKSPAEECIDAFGSRSRIRSIDSTVLAHPTNSGETLGFLARCVRGVVARAGRPVTAFDVARDVLKAHPNRWASSSVRKKVSQLAKRGVLREVDCEGVSLDHAPCFRYVLGSAT